VAETCVLFPTIVRAAKSFWRRQKESRCNFVRTGVEKRNSVGAAGNLQGQSLLTKTKQLKKDKKIVEAAVKNNPSSFYLANDALKSDPKFVIKLMEAQKSAKSLNDSLHERCMGIRSLFKPNDTKSELSVDTWIDENEI